MVLFKAAPRKEFQLKCVKITSFFFVLLFELLPDTTSTVSGDCDFLRSCVNYKYIEKKKKKKKKKKVFWMREGLY